MYAALVWNAACCPERSTTEHPHEEVTCEGKAVRCTLLPFVPNHARYWALDELRIRHVRPMQAPEPEEEEPIDVQPSPSPQPPPPARETTIFYAPGYRVTFHTSAKPMAGTNSQACTVCRCDAGMLFRVLLV